MIAQLALELLLVALVAYRATILVVDDELPFGPVRRAVWRRCGVFDPDGRQFGDRDRDWPVSSSRVFVALGLGAFTAAALAILLDLDDPIGWAWWAALIVVALVVAYLIALPSRIGYLLTCRLCCSVWIGLTAWGLWENLTEPAERLTGLDWTEPAVRWALVPVSILGATRYLLGRA